ncbi:MAG: 3-hydroxyacyl-CoA dehydrogenase NAD-binding domain-containing protein [Xanthomonadales bacterium]|nr:3-hydroxyacyl-CoA dehydrogenase NAD-binding domain-containing protein [Xanthomonadales bacterium]
MNTTASKDTIFKHWKLSTDIDNVVWLSLDREGESTNSLSLEVLSELGAIIDTLETNAPAGLVLQSAKPGSFIVGADVREFDDYDDADMASDGIDQVHRLFNRIEALPFPKVVVIDGFCLGGGLELALAFDYRIATNVEHTRLGFPEIKLGIYPGFGGSARSVQQAGASNAMQLMLSTRNLRAGAARAMGLVDELVGAHGSLRWAARRAIKQGRKSRKPGQLKRLQNFAPVRSILARVMRKQVAARANPDHYPAPFELIEAWEQYGDDPQRMMAEESDRVGKLITGTTSKSLRRVFFLMERLKGMAKQSDVKFRRVHVIGAGVMGGDIAAWCVLQGMDVTLQDRELKYIEPALKRAKSLFQKKLKNRNKVTGALSRLVADVEGKGVSHADVIIEAIFEDVDAKRELFANIEARMKPDAVLATNTSAIPLAEISSVLKKPERLIGIHFFNPVAKMPLVEVVYDEKSDAGQVAKGAAFCGAINRFPLPVKSSPGFLVNRVLSGYMAKAMSMHLERGIPIEILDKAATSFGMPMGPVELADTVGLDVCMKVVGLLGGESSKKEAALLQEKVHAGDLGKKSGKGFYVWEKGKPKREDQDTGQYALEEITESLMQPYFEACEAALADGIVEDADVLDAGMIFGTGFAPFRGGPLYYLEQEGAKQ